MTSRQWRKTWRCILFGCKYTFAIREITKAVINPDGRSVTIELSSERTLCEWCHQ